MKTLIFLIRKEFRQIKRNKVLLPIIFIMPILQLLILVHATTFQIRNVNIGVVDNDKSTTSLNLINTLGASEFFSITAFPAHISEAESMLAKSQIDMIMVIPQNFGSNLVREKQADIQFIPNAINVNFATLAYSYATMVLRSFNIRIITETTPTIMPVQHKVVNIIPRYYFNSEMNYKWYMFPGIMVILITMIGLFLSGLNLVREKEIGTSEQLNVTPIKKHHFILAKLIPFLIIGLLELTLATVLGILVYNVPFEGNFLVLVGFTFIYLFVVLGIGLLISTMANTQQQMMFVAFFVVIIFILLSGIFTPAESMPNWVQKLNVINPIAYFMKVIRMVMLKGSGINNLIHELISMTIYAIIVLSLATFRYRKTS